MSINSENYGAWIVDYFDGRLSEKEVRQLMLYLDAHPECKAEFDTFEPVSLQKEAVSFPDKEGLKHKEIIPVGRMDETNYQEIFMEAHDGALSQDETEVLRNFLKKNPHLKDEFDQFGKLYLPVDLSVTYDDKAGLKHMPLFPLIRNFSMALAAVFLLLLGFRFFMPVQGERNPHQMAGIQLITPIKGKSIEVMFNGLPQVRLLSKQFEKKDVSPRVTMPKEERLAAMHVLDSYKAGFSMLQSTAYVDLLFPSGESIQSSFSYDQPLVVEHRKSGPVKRVLSKTFAKFDGLLAKSRSRRKNGANQEKGLVKVLDSGVSAFNGLTDSDKLVMVKTYDNQGNLLAFQVLGDGFHFQKKMKRASSSE